ncbi:MAG: transcriptional regulator [bacterium]
MKLSRISELLNCKVLSGADKLDREISSCMSSDMMSDVLAFANPGSLLMTGLVNSQSVRTAEIADASAIVYLRGKRPEKQTIDLSEALSIPLLCTDLGMFEACGILHKEGLLGIC